MTDKQREKLESQISDVEDMLYRVDDTIRKIKKTIDTYYDHKPEEKEKEGVRELLRILLNKENHGPHTIEDAVVAAQAILDK